MFLFTTCGTESPQFYTLTTSVNGEGTITPGEYEKGETVTLRSNPSEHWSFDSWSGDATGSSAALTITIETDRSVVGIFFKREYFYLSILMA